MFPISATRQSDQGHLRIPNKTTQREHNNGLCWLGRGIKRG